MPSRLERRVGRLEGEAGHRSFDESELERAGKIIRAHRMVKSYPSQATDEDRAIFGATTGEDETKAFLLGVKVFGFTAIVQASLKVPLDQIPPPEHYVVAWMEELDRDAPDLAAEVRAGRKDVEKAAHELHGRRYGRDSHGPIGPQPEDEFSVPPRPEALAAQAAHERRCEPAGSDQGEPWQERERDYDQVGPLPAPPPFDPRTQWKIDSDRAEQRERLRQAQNEVYHPFGKDW